MYGTAGRSHISVVYCENQKCFLRREFAESVLLLVSPLLKKNVNKYFSTNADTTFQSYIDDIVTFLLGFLKMFCPYYYLTFATETEKEINDSSRYTIPNFFVSFFPKFSRPKI